MLRVVIVVFVSILMAALAPSAMAEKRVALVIGNANYEGLAALPNPVNDANGIAGLLQDRLSFEVIRLLDADQGQMTQAMAMFGRAAADADVALFFYAGHGIELDSANYMLPVKADIRSDSDLVNMGVRLDQVVDTMVRAGAKVKIVLVDACRNNPLASRGMRGARSLGLKEYYATNIDTLIAFATEPGRVAYDGNGRNSPFTEGLIANLAEPGIEVQSMLRRVRAAVYAATQKRQFPWWDDMFLNDVYLGGPDPNGDKVGEDRQAHVLDVPQVTTLGEDVQLCEKLGRDGDNTLMMEAYLDRYPQGFCAAAIRKRLDSMADAAPSGLAEPAMAVSTSDGQDVALRAAPEEEPSDTAYAISSYWNHNNSLVALSASGDSRVFYYERPRELMAKAGVSRGSLLFKGRISGRTYSGMAYLFSKRCAPVAYKVSGQVSADFTRVELHGAKPVRDRNCREIGTKPDRLVFEYHSKSL